MREECLRTVERRSRAEEEVCNPGAKMNLESKRQVWRFHWNNTENIKEKRISYNLFQIFTWLWYSENYSLHCPESTPCLPHMHLWIGGALKNKMARLHLEVRWYRNEHQAQRTVNSEADGKYMAGKWRRSTPILSKYIRGCGPLKGDVRPIQNPKSHPESSAITKLMYDFH